MFTVCPKCALTLVVTAADLRVAQGFVRCGRCSNVFNALARLSEDRQAAAAVAQAQLAAESSGSARASTGSRPRPDTSATFRARQLADTPPPTTPELPSPSSTAPAASGQPSQAATQRKSPAPSEPPRYDDNSILDEDLEFKPEVTDVSKVFVEQAPSPEFTAATGTFKALRLEAEAAARIGEDRGAQAGERTLSSSSDPADAQVDVEIDSDAFEAMVQMTGNRLARLDLTSAPAEDSHAEATPASTAPGAGAARGATSSVRAGTAGSATAPATAAQATPATAQATVAAARTTAATAAAPKQQAAKTPPASPDPAAQEPRSQGTESGSQPGISMRLAERAKARAAAARPPSIETSEALRAALMPRQRALPPAGAESASLLPTPLPEQVWKVGSVVLVVLLAVQVAHHYRNDLAATASLNRPLTSLYGTLGIPLVPRWNVEAYEVRQLGASTTADAPGQITVRASVKNDAQQAQPLPLLRVTLQDRFGNRIAARDVPPQSYLPRALASSPVSSAGQLSAGQRVDAEMAFVDPGSNAVGFEIDACLPAPDGGVTCANDAAR